MDISEQKSCPICGIKKPINAFRNKNGKITTICLQCLEKESDGDQGGGGFQVNIIDKLAAIAIEQEQAKTEAATEHLAVTERLHHPEEQKKYSSSLFNEKRTGETLRTTDNKTPQKQTTEISYNKTAGESEQNNQVALHESKTTQPTNSQYQNTLFAGDEQKQTNKNTVQTDSTISQEHIEAKDPNPKSYSAEKTNAAIRRSLFGANVPSAETLREASGNKTPAVVQNNNDVKTKTENTMDALASRFIDNVLRGPGRR